MNIFAMQSDLADFPKLDWLPILVDEGQSMSRVGPPHASRLGRPFEVAVANQIVHFCLTKHFVWGEAQLSLAPLKYGFANTFPGTHQCSERQVICLSRTRH